MRPSVLLECPHADLVLTSLLYDTGIFMANLLIVFDDAKVVDMVVDVLALEFFTLIDDEFKRILIDYDDSFLDDMLIVPSSEPRRRPVSVAPGTDPGHGTKYSERSSSWKPGPVGGSALTQALFNAADDPEAGPTPRQPRAGPRDGGDEGVCTTGFIWLIMLPLQIIRLTCRIAGPLFAAVMMVYGPYCLAAE